MDAVNVLSAQLTRDLFAIAKFLSNLNRLAHNCNSAGYRFGLHVQMYTVKQKLQPFSFCNNVVKNILYFDNFWAHRY